MTTFTDKKQYPGEQYLNELITNIEFAARAPVEVVRAMAAELQKRREADSAEPASNHEELPLDYLQGQKDGLEWAAQLAEANHPQTGDWLYDDPVELAKAIRKGPDMPEAAGNSPVIPDGWVIVPKELTPEMMRAVQIRSELGGYATSNLSGAYNMFSEFWNVAVSAAPKVDDL
ncbi:Eaa protein [Escherichia coli]|uniref:Eaa protein n=1 Tax=Escherichia coli TaxID=562 RepID=UPI000D1696A1|nr:Eaa protein [Escherichia coli]PSY69720.1 Eaa protein [Escherichia coli]